MDHVVRTKLQVSFRKIYTMRGLPVLVSILMGLLLACFAIISPTAAVMALFSGILLAVTILLRKTEYLLFTWFVLTSLIWLVMVRVFPNYYSFVGRGIFWGILFCTIAAWAIDNILSGRKFMPFDNLPIKVVLLAFLLWCSVTLFTSLDVLNSIKKVAHVVIGLAASYMFYDFLSRDQNHLRKVLGMLLVLVIFISLIAVALAGHSLMSGLRIYKQISLWFFNPNVLGTLLFMCLPILIAAGFYFVSNKAIKIIFISAMLLALVFSFHRTSWVAASASIAFLIWKGRMKIPMWATIVAGLFFLSIAFPVIGQDIYDLVTGERYSGRIEIWKAAWKTACNYPLLGTGPGNVFEVMHRYIDTPWLKGQDTHSVYLKNAAEMGFVSVAIVLAFFGVFFYSSARIEKRLKSDYLRLATRGATATLLGIFIHGFLENGFLLTAFDAGEFTVIMPYILIAVPFAAKRLEERQEAGRDLRLEDVRT